MTRALAVEPIGPRPDYAKFIKLVEAGELDEAYRLVDEVLTRDPDDAQALVIAAECLKKAKKLPIAYSLAKRAAEIKPQRPEPWAALGHAAQQLWRIDEALSCYRKALQRAQTDKQRSIYENNIASALLDSGQFAKAEPFARQALAHDETNPNVRHNIGLTLLAQHKWREGWQQYASSIGSVARLNIKYRKPDEPTWDGTAGQAVVVYGEQGLGDEICAASILPDVIRDSRKVIVDCDERLQWLFRRSFPQAHIYGTRWHKSLAWAAEDQDFDASIAGFEVAKFYRNETADFPGTPYLTPCPIRTAGWRSVFAQQRKPVIGIAWSGGIWQNASAFRQLPLAEWGPIFGAVDAHWVSLQYKDAAREIEGHPVTQYPWATLTKDYDDTAALVAACDLVLCMQTTVGHLAGALGVPAWVMVPTTSQWRYGEAGDSIPWYRSMRIFRQRDKAWPVQEIAGQLRTRFAHH